MGLAVDADVVGGVHAKNENLVIWSLIIKLF